MVKVTTVVWKTEWPEFEPRVSKITSREVSLSKTQNPCQPQCCCSVAETDLWPEENKVYLITIASLFIMSCCAPLYQCSSILVRERGAESWERQRGGWGREHLSPVEGLAGGVAVVEETHVDEVDEQAGRVLGGVGIIGCPLVEDQQNKVAKQTRHEDDLWDEAQEDVQRLLEVPVVKWCQLTTQMKQIL